MNSSTDEKMRVLVVKLTSMGDAIHLLPALTDLQAMRPEVKVDWMIEDSFHEIPGWHASVDRVIPVSTRRWRSLSLKNLREFLAFVKLLRREPYDVVIDAQGLMKSAALGRFARLRQGGKRIGYSADCIKEKMAARFYRIRISIPRGQHAIDRLRRLFAEAFDYPLPNDSPDYALAFAASARQQKKPVVIFCHGTTWASKHLPDQHWRDLLQVVLKAGYTVKICWGSESEKRRAEWIAQNKADVEVLPKLSLGALAQVLKASDGVIAVDTGLGHLAAALGVPTASVYGATDASLTGAVGDSQAWLQCHYHCSPCFLKECNKLTEDCPEPPCYQTLSAGDIWNALKRIIAEAAPRL
ncbi:MAG: lipopolysaccharide heptosyltransferase I [Gammaproteobacteria bacterium]|nr:lipopolysaccharide heptosyltransferase I [Gammaproteobacteria bacterium]